MNERLLLHCIRYVSVGNIKIDNLKPLLVHLWIRQLKSWTWPLIPAQNRKIWQQTHIEWIHAATQWTLLEQQVQAIKSLDQFVQTAL